MLAVCACVDSYWRGRRKPDLIAALLAAGASKEDIAAPCGYAEADAPLLPREKSPPELRTRNSWLVMEIAAWWGPRRTTRPTMTSFRWGPHASRTGQSTASRTGRPRMSGLSMAKSTPLLLMSKVFPGWDALVPESQRRGLSI